MTAPALPPDDVVDQIATILKRAYGLELDPRVNVDARVREEIRTAIARALGGDGEPVAWGVMGSNGKCYEPFLSEADAAAKADMATMAGYGGGPFRAAPLFTRPAATCDTGEGERAKVAAWEAAHDSLRDDVLHNADGFDNDTVNHYLGMIDDADQRPYTHIATKGGPDAR